MAIEVFTLEALNAQHGDSLLLHYGSKSRPSVLVVDGGPRGVYKASLRPRLEQLRTKAKVDKLPIEHVFVTHLDSDHIRGIIDLAAEIKKGEAPVECTSFWFNTFEDAMTALPPEVAAAKGGLEDDDMHSSDAVIASVPEGQSLRDTVATLKARVNGGSGALLLADGKGVPLKVSKDLKVTLVCPDKDHLRKLAKDWQKKAKPSKAETAAYVDQSVYNLSSLVMVVEASDESGKSARILLTGDARGDHILAGLKAAGFLSSKGTAHFNILKVSHHGSDRDYEAEFFKKVTADNYVISANGRDENPSLDVLEWIAQGAKKPYVVWMTNEKDTGYSALEENVAAAKKAAPNLKAALRFRKATDLSVKVDLFKPIA